MNTENDPLTGSEESSSSWLYDHIGRLIGLVGGLLLFAILVFLATIGFTPALYIMVFVLSGVVLIIGGGKIHRALAMAQFRDEGIALRAMRLGETDRIVTFLTVENGKVRAVAKGVRKPKNRIGSRVEPLSHVSMLCWRGRELDTVNQVELLESFRAIRGDLARMSPALIMLEIVDQVALERHESPELFAMLLGALRTLEGKYSPFILGAFCFKLLGLEGVGPITNSCANCGSLGDLVAFDATIGGLLCQNCRRGQAVSPQVVTYLQMLGAGGLSRLLEEPPGPAAKAFEDLGLATIEHHLGRRLRSVHASMQDERKGS